MSICWPDVCRYIYQDLRGHWHLLAHVYNTAPFATTGLNYISGHGFSQDGEWNVPLKSALLSLMLTFRRWLS